MGWGDWPSWVAIVVSVVTAVVTWVQGRRQAKAATAAAAQATALAQDANRSAASMARSLDAIAKELGPHGGMTAREAVVPASGRPAWNVEYRGGGRYVLRNVGGGPASGVRVDGPPGSGVQDAVAGVDLAPGEGSAFTVRSGARPAEVTVTCAETGSESVPLP